MIRAVRLGVLGCAAVCVAAAAQAAPSSPREQLHETRQDLHQGRGDLRDLKRRLKDEQQRVKQGQRQERSLLTQLQQAERRIEEASERYAEDQRNLALVLESLGNLREATAETERTLDEMRELLAARLRLLYREGRLGLWRLLITSRSPAEALTRLKFFRVLAAQNAYWVERLNISRRNLAQQKVELAAREAQVRELEAGSKRTLERIRVERAARERMLQRVRTERAAHEETVRELGAAAQRLNALLTRLERRALDLERRAAEAERRKRTAAGRTEPKAAPPPALPPVRIKMLWPTRGRVITPFGRTRHPRFNTYVTNKGIDITGALGQNVTAVSAGRVLFAEWFEGYGRMVILDHGNGLNTIYAHLDKIMVSEDQAVTAGQTLGTLGDSGSWKGPCLYFELRHRGEALDPLPWLTY